MSYEGTIKYQDQEGYFEVLSLTKDEKTLSIDGASITPTFNRWDFQVTLPLLRDIFQSEHLTAVQNGQKSDPFTLRVKIENETPGTIEISGIWIEKRYSSRFRGVLNAKT